MPQPPLWLDGPAQLNGMVIAGTEGLTIAQVRAAVARGGRFVIYQYCFSVLILSFKQSSSLTFVRPDENRTKCGLQYTLISLLVGWWGIPWGPVWTISTVTVNLNGGQDVTRETMLGLGLDFVPSQPPPQSAASMNVSALRPKPAPNKWLWKVATIALVCLSLLTI